MLSFKSLRQALLVGVATCGTAAAIGASEQPAYAQEVTRTYNIQAQDLNSALREFALQTGRDVLYPPEIVAGKRSNGAQGQLAERQALEALLAGTGLRFEQTASNGYAVQDPASPTQLGVADAASGYAEAEEVIVVTGTHLRGVAPPGQSLTVIDDEDIDNAGFSTAPEIIRSLPQNFTGGVRQDNLGLTGGNERSVANTTSASSPNLRGLGPNTTLSLVNGRRFAPAGGLAAYTDISAIPVVAIERVEVLPDGASAIYGADAIGGVVNFVLRDDFEGSELRLRYGQVTEGSERQGQIGYTLGGHWQGGNFLASLEYLERDGLPLSERDPTGGDLRSFGGRDFRISRCNPGTLIVGATTYAIPASQDGTSLSPGDFVAGTRNLCSPALGQMLSPDEERWSLFTHFEHDLSSSITLNSDLLYAHRDLSGSIPNNALTLAVPNTNPFYINPTGGTGPVRVDYDFTDDLGPRRFENIVDTVSASIGAEFELPRQWSLDSYIGYAGETGNQFQTSTPDPAGLTAALADTNPLTAFNPFGEGSNTNPATLDLLRDSSTTRFRSDSSLAFANVIVSGPILQLPAGDARLALGADYRVQSFDTRTRNDLLIAGTNTSSQTSFDRNISSAFAELFVPIVGDEANIPATNRLELSLAGRYESYNDFGDAFVPRVGIVWSPVRDIDVRASWSESFKAPNLPDLDETNNGSLIIALPDPTSLTGFTNTLAHFGNNRDLGSESATSWTIGIDVASSLLRGFSFGATYFELQFEDRVGSPPSFSLAPANGPAIDRTPTAEERARICSSTNFAGNFTSNPGDCLTAPIDAIFDFRLQNLAIVQERGIDANVSYAMDVAGGEARFGLTSTYLFEYDLKSTSEAPTVEALNTEGDPLRFRLRGSLGWSNETNAVNLYVNYANAYSDTLSVPTREIDSWTTVDLNLAHTFGDVDERESSVRLSLNVTNLFDEPPPFFNNSRGIPYDPANANIQGRFVSIDLRKRW